MHAGGDFCGLEQTVNAGLKHSDFNRLCLVSVEIFSNYLKYKLFIDTQSGAKSNLIKMFILASICSVREIFHFILAFFFISLQLTVQITSGAE